MIYHSECYSTDAAKVRCFYLLIIFKINFMAHNLNFNEQTGEHSFFSVKEKACHGLGQIVQDYPTSAEALKFAGLDYTVISPNAKVSWNFGYHGIQNAWVKSSGAGISPFAPNC